MKKNASHDSLPLMRIAFKFSRYKHKYPLKF